MSSNRIFPTHSSENSAWNQLIALHMFAKNGEEMKLEETEEFKKLVENARRDILAPDGYERDFERCCGIGRRNRSLL